MHSQEHIKNLENILSDVDLLPSAMNPAKFDGFVAGILSCPERIAPEEWIALALGQQESWYHLNEAAAQPIVDTLVAHFNRVAWNLLEKDTPYVVLLEQGDDVEPYWSLWVSGFFAVNKLRPKAFNCYVSANPDAEEAFAHIKCLHDVSRGHLALSDADLKVLNSSAPEIIPYLVLHMYHWLEMKVVPNGPLKGIAWDQVKSQQPSVPTYH